MNLEVIKYNKFTGESTDKEFNGLSKMVQEDIFSMVISLQGKPLITPKLVPYYENTEESKNPKQLPFLEHIKASNNPDTKKFMIRESKYWNYAKY